MISALKFLPALLSLSCTTGPDRRDATLQDEQTAGSKGLPVSAHVPSFQPVHVTGPHAGRNACPLCVYGLVPQLQVWVQEDSLEKGIELAQRAETLAAEGKVQGFVAYGVIVPSHGRELSDRTKATLLRSTLKAFFWTTVPSWSDSGTSGLYGHSDQDKPSVRVYSVVNRRLFRRWDDPGVNRWPEVQEAVRRSAGYVSTYELTDAQIAPLWERGDRMEVRFRVADAQGRPLEKIKVTAMQTDASGRYNPEGWNRREPSLKATAWTDKDGLVTFQTIVPGPYPTRREPSHIHFSAGVDGRACFRTLWFEGDPLISKERREWAERDEETMIVPVSRAEGRRLVEHTFVVRR
ncbi:MAG: hypothetical protein JST30_17165 [Armatimonadetes bacterium]|nr:hypothetical protein [Armatimonadota bacterium]